MKENLKKVNLKKKEYIIIIMINGKMIDIKEIIKIVIKKEKDYFTIIMDIEKWEIF